MKSCPKCGANLSDNQNICPQCGGDYVQLSIEGITGKRESNVTTNADSPANDANAPMLLEYMENNIESATSLTPPSLRESFNQVADKVNGIAGILQIVAGIMTDGAVFYVLGAAFTGISALASWRVRKRSTVIGKNAAILTATSNVFEQNTKSILDKHSDDPAIVERINTLQTRLAEVKKKHEEKHRANTKSIWIITAICAAIFAVGVGTLTVKTYKVRKAEAEYAAQPTWVKVRDAYITSEYNDEYGDNSARIYVLTEMLNAGQMAAAESFFFDYCMGNVGDYDCAELIIKRYRADNDKASLEVFVERLDLRYDSDTQKAKQL